MLIHPGQHAHLRCLPIENRTFAAAEPSVALVASDVQALAGSGIPIILPVTPDALPKALLTDATHDDPLAGHTPLLWQAYPFSLVRSVVGADAKGVPTCQNVLWAEPDAPHWSQTHGDRLFTLSGHPAPFLEAVLERLQEQERQACHTRELIALLHQAEALTTAYVDYQGQTHAIYRINMDNLGERLQALDGDKGLLAFYFATLVEQSQQGLIQTHDTLRAFPRRGDSPRFAQPAWYESEAPTPVLRDARVI